MTHKHWTNAAEPGEMAFVTTPAEGLWAESRALALETASRTHPVPPKRSVCQVRPHHGAWCGIKLMSVEEVTNE